MILRQPGLYPIPCIRQCGSVIHKFPCPVVIEHKPSIRIRFAFPPELLLPKFNKPALKVSDKRLICKKVIFVELTVRYELITLSWLTFITKVPLPKYDFLEVQMRFYILKVFLHIRSEGPEPVFVFFLRFLSDRVVWSQWAPSSSPLCCSSLSGTSGGIRFAHWEGYGGVIRELLGCGVSIAAAKGVKSAGR